MSVSALSSSSSSYWEKMLAQMKSSSESESQDSLASKLFGDLDSDGDGTLSLSETGLSDDLFTSMDADGDGSVSQTELQQAIETQRKAMFTNMQLGQSEASAQASAMEQPSAQDMLASIMSGQTPPPPPQEASAGQDDDSDLASKLFSSLDSDGSGSLSQDETGLSQSVFDAMDTDQDGTVSAEELAAALQKQREAMGMGGQAAQGQSVASSTEESDAKDLLASIMSGQMPPPPPQSTASSAAQSGASSMASNLFSSLDSDSSDGLSIDETGLSQSVFDAMDTNQDGSVSAEELAAALQQQREDMMGNQSGNRNDMASSFLSALANSAYQASSLSSTASQSVEAVA